MNYDDLFVTFDLPKPLSKSEFYEYLKKYQEEGNELARKKIIEQSIRLVIYEVKKRFKKTSCDQKELVSLGLLGLIKSIDTFDISRNIAFSTYAVRCIDNEILMYLKKNNKYQTEESFDKKLGSRFDKNGLQVEEVLSDRNSDIVADYEDRETYRIVRQMVEDLPDREKKIIKLFFGFIDDRIYTQQEIAALLGISQSCVSRLIKKTVRTLGQKMVEYEELSSADMSKQTVITPKQEVNIMSEENGKNKRLIKRG